MPRPSVDLAGCGPVSWPGSAAQLAGWLFLIWAAKVLTAGGEVRAVAEDGVTRSGESHQAGGAVRQLVG